MLAVCDCMVHPTTTTTTTTMMLFALTLRIRHLPAPSLHDIHRLAWCIDRDHSIRKRHLLPLDWGLKPSVIAIDARSRRHNRCKYGQIGIQIKSE